MARQPLKIMTWFWWEYCRTCWRQVDTREREKDTDRDWFIAKSYFQQTPGLIAQTGHHKYKSPQRITQCLVRSQRCARFNWILLKMEHFHVNSSPYQSNIYVYIYSVCDLHPCQILVNKLISNAAYNHNRTSKLQSLMKIWANSHVPEKPKFRSQVHIL